MTPHPILLADEPFESAVPKCQPQQDAEEGGENTARQRE
jgi:hypothetical protein